MNDGVILHFLNGTAIEEPKGWEDFSDELVRDIKERIIGTKYKVSLTFTGSGHSFLQGVFDADGPCAIVTYEAKQWCAGVQYSIIRGTVSLSECKFNETRCEVEADIADDGVGARVINNKEIPVSPEAELTKNSKPLTPVTPVALEVFDPAAAAGTWIVTTRTAYDWFDCFQHLVLYITDNTVSLVSDWYGDLDDDERYAIVTGFELRNATGSSAPLVYSFKAVFDELGKKYNLWIGVERVAGVPVLRLEPEGYFYDDAGTLIHTDIQDLVRATDLDRLWAKVIVGSDTFIKEQASALSLPFLPLRGFTKEEFHFEGVCNTSETLDLVNKWIIDTNVIEDVVVNGNDEYDDDIFLIQYNHTTSRATKGDYLNPGANPYLYNEQLQNSLVIERYDLPSAVGAFFSTTDASFQAERTAPGAPENYTGPAGTSALAIFQYDNDYTAPNFDTTNSWGNGTVQGNPVSQANSRYTAAAQGYYEFDVSVLWRIDTNIPLVVVPGPIPVRAYKSIRIIFQVERYDAANTLIGTPLIITGPYQYTPGGIRLDGGGWLGFGGNGLRSGQVSIRPYHPNGSNVLFRAFRGFAQYHGQAEQRQRDPHVIRHGWRVCGRWWSG